MHVGRGHEHDVTVNARCDHIPRRSAPGAGGGGAVAGCDSHEARAGGWKFFSIITDRMQRVWFPFVPGQRIPFLAGMYSKLQHVKLKALLFFYVNHVK